MAPGKDLCFGWMAAVTDISKDFIYRLQEALNDLEVIPTARSSDATLVKCQDVFYVLRLAGGRDYDACVEIRAWTCSRKAPKREVGLYEMVAGGGYRRIGAKRLARRIREAADAMLHDAVSVIPWKGTRTYELAVLNRACGFGGFTLVRSYGNDLVARGIDPAVIGLRERRLVAVGRGMFRALRYTLLGALWLVAGTLQLTGWLLKGMSAKN